MEILTLEEKRKQKEMRSREKHSRLASLVEKYIPEYGKMGAYAKVSEEEHVCMATVQNAYKKMNEYGKGRAEHQG